MVFVDCGIFFKKSLKMYFLHFCHRFKSCTVSYSNSLFPHGGDFRMLSLWIWESWKVISFPGWIFNWVGTDSMITTPSNCRIDLRCLQIITLITTLCHCAIDAITEQQLQFWENEDNLLSQSRFKLWLIGNIFNPFHGAPMGQVYRVAFLQTPKQFCIEHYSFGLTKL